MAELLLLIFQAATVYVVVRRMNFLTKRPFAGAAVVARTGLAALPVLAIPVIILGGIFSGVFTPTESASVASVVAIALALFWFASVAPRELPSILVLAGLETGIVMLLLGDSAILAKALFLDRFGQTLEDFFTGVTDNKYVFLLLVNVILLAVGIFVEPLPALYILAPVLAPIAIAYGIDPVHFGLIMVFNLVIALIHPPIGLVIFLVSSLAKVSVERLSIMILPWLAVSLVVLFLVTYLPSEVVLALSNLARLRSSNALGVAAMLCWGIAYVPSAWLVESWPPLLAAGARLMLGGVLLLALLAILGRPLSPGVGVAAVGWLALTQTVLFYGAVFWGIAHAGAGLSAVLANTDPLFVAVLAVGFLGERLGGAAMGGPGDRAGRRGRGRLGGPALAA